MVYSEGPGRQEPCFIHPQHKAQCLEGEKACSGCLCSCWNFLFHHPALPTLICIIWVLYRYSTSAWFFPPVFIPLGLHFLFKNLCTWLNTLATGNIYMVIRNFRNFFNSIFYSVASSGILKWRTELSLEHCFLSDTKFLPFFFFFKNRDLHLLHIYLANFPDFGKLILAIILERKGTIFHFIFIISVFSCI